MDDLQAIESLGFALPTPAYMVGAILFGIIGFAAYRYGKKASLSEFKWLGIALMIYPYAVTETWLLYTIGVAFCVGLYWLRK